jgi:hypothetical protein
MTITVLVEDQLGRPPLFIRHKRDLRVDALCKIIMGALRKYFDLPLPDRLCHEVIAIPRDRQDEIRGQLKESPNSMKKNLGSGNFFRTLR